LTQSSICEPLDHCLIRKSNDASKCTKCTSCYFLDASTSLCVKECDAITQFTDTVSWICRKLCGKAEFYDPINPLNCLPCTSKIPHCLECYEKDEIVGGPV